MLHDQTKLKEYIAANAVFSREITSIRVNVEELQKLFVGVLGEKYLHSELVKVVFEITGISRTEVCVDPLLNDFELMWYLNENFYNSLTGKKL